MIYPSSKLELSSSHPGSGRRLPLILGTEPFQTQKVELPKRPAFHPELETESMRHGHNESQQVTNIQPCKSPSPSTKIVGDIRSKPDLLCTSAVGN